MIKFGPFLVKFVHLHIKEAYRQEQRDKSTESQFCPLLNPGIEGSRECPEECMVVRLGGKNAAKPPPSLKSGEKRRDSSLGM